MNARETRQYEMLLRLRDFGNTQRDVFAGFIVAQQAFAAVGRAIDELTATDIRKMSAWISPRAGRKAAAREALIELLLKASQLVKVLRARGQATPPFGCPESRSDQALLTAGRQFERDAATLEAECTGHDGPDTHRRHAGTRASTTNAGGRGRSARRSMGTDSGDNSLGPAHRGFGVTGEAATHLAGAVRVHEAGEHHGPGRVVELDRADLHVVQCPVCVERGHFMTVSRPMTSAIAVGVRRSAPIVCHGLPMLAPLVLPHRRRPMPAAFR
jgi:hypothetical protein